MVQETINFQCNFCDETFDKNWRRYLHIKKKHSKNMLFCGLCKYKTRLKVNLKYHLTKVFNFFYNLFSYLFWVCHDLFFHCSDACFLGCMSCYMITFCLCLIIATVYSHNLYVTEVEASAKYNMGEKIYSKPVYKKFLHTSDYLSVRKF
jgi:hypothetical protein